tara:strand:+ start:215 stop:1195 length:981 start_codon:yes stop_codon:yes gene_type:complete
MSIENYIKNVFKIKSESEFNDFALQLFHYQKINNPVYRKYIDLIGYDIKPIKEYSEIPFLPIELFRSEKIITKNAAPQAIFNSSGTTNKQKSKHYVLDLEIYKKSIMKSFNLFIGDPKDFVFLCFAPNTAQNPNSSLSFMCTELIKNSKKETSGFYLKRENEAISNIHDFKKNNQKFILFGLSLELLKFAEKNNISLEHGIVIETGGSKNQNKHFIKDDLHSRLKSHFNTQSIYSEYGMCELLSQSYYGHNKCFKSPPWKKILIRDKTNPLKITNQNRGSINIIDLANIYSCGFIATNDSGYLTNDGFNIIGRNQNSIARGCDLMV